MAEEAPKKKINFTKIALFGLGPIVLIGLGYYTFADNFTTNLNKSKQFLQISVGVSTQYDETVIENVEKHQMALRSEVLGVIGTYSVEDIDGKLGRDKLADSIMEAINVKLLDLEGFGGVEGVHFTSFVLQ